MTPATVDRWALMLLQLSGEEVLPAPPPLPGRVHRGETRPEGTDQRLQSYGRAAAFVAKVAPGWRVACWA